MPSRKRVRGVWRNLGRLADFFSPLGASAPAERRLSSGVMSARPSSIMEAAGFTGRGSVAGTGISRDALMEKSFSLAGGFQAK